MTPFRLQWFLLLIKRLKYSYSFFYYSAVNSHNINEFHHIVVNISVLQLMQHKCLSHQALFVHYYYCLCLSFGFRLAGSMHILYKAFDRVKGGQQCNISPFLTEISSQIIFVLSVLFVYMV